MISLEDCYIKCSNEDCKKEIRLYDQCYYTGHFRGEFNLVNDDVFCSIKCLRLYGEEKK